MHAAARVDDVRHVPFALVGLGAEQRFVEMADHDGRVVEVEQQRTQRVAPERPDTVGDHEPTGFGLER